jgi:hypothetical protein
MHCVGTILQQSYWLQLEYLESSLEHEIRTFSGDRKCYGKDM